MKCLCVSSFLMAQDNCHEMELYVPLYICFAFLGSVRNYTARLLYRASTLPAAAPSLMVKILNYFPSKIECTEALYLQPWLATVIEQCPCRVVTSLCSSHRSALNKAVYGWQMV